jgi:hypothetical protein
MKLTLIEGLTRGVLTDYHKEIGERIDIETAAIGTLTVGAYCHKPHDGRVTVPQHHLAAGKNKVTFTTPNGTVYKCGAIIRSGRLISVVNPTDDIVACLAIAYVDLKRKFEELEEKIKDAEENRGIKII